MARPLAAGLPGFAATLSSCLAIFKPDLVTMLATALYDPDFPVSELNRTEVAQPALFAVEFAAATALGRLGIHPTAMIGHSLGELTAACLAGTLRSGYDHWLPRLHRIR